MDAPFIKQTFLQTFIKTAILYRTDENAIKLQFKFQRVSARYLLRCSNKELNFRKCLGIQVLGEHPPPRRVYFQYAPHSFIWKILVSGFGMVDLIDKSRG